MPLPPGVTTANYQVTFETVSASYILTNSVGPYLDGSPEPSGTLAAISVPSMQAGSAQTLTVNVADSAMGDYDDAIGSQAQPRPLPASGLWAGRLGQVGQTDWFNFPVRGGRSFTVVTLAVDETGAPTDAKAMPSLGVWDAFDAVGSKAVGYGAGLNGLATGESWLQVAAGGDDIVRLGIADERGDGRPDYAYQGWVLYADTVFPLRLPASGGAIVIHGMGFRSTDTVQVGGQQALITSITPNEITAIAPAAASGVTGSVNVEVDDLPTYNASAIITGGISYDAGSGDSLTLLIAPTSSVPIGVPEAFTVLALDSNLNPAGGVSVIYTVTSGTRHAGLRPVHLHGDRHRRRTRHHERDSHQQRMVDCHRLAHQQLHQLKNRVLWRNAAHAGLAHLNALAGRRSHLHLDNAGPGPQQRQSPQRPVRRLADDRQRHHLPERRGHHQLQRHRRQDPSPWVRSPRAKPSPPRPASTEPIQCITYTAFGSRPEYATLVAVSGTSQSLAVSGTPAPDHPARPRHGRQPHGRRHGHALSGALRLDAALRAARPLRASRAAGHAGRHSQLRPRRHRQLFPRIDFRRGYGPAGIGRHWQHRQREHRRGAASVELRTADSY